MKSLREMLQGQLPAAGVPDIEVSGLCLDSRRIRAGEAFLALAGERSHGLQWAPQAMARGAAVILHDGRAEVPTDLLARAVAVPGLKRHLPALCRRMWNDPASHLELIAVTGTNGKSSIAWLMAQALEAAMIGTLGVGLPGRQRPASHTTPDLPGLYGALAELRDQGIRVVAMEASSHALDQKRLAGLSFASTIFTNLGRDHLDYHGTRAAYGAAKARLFFDYPSSRRLINLDDAFGVHLWRRLSGSLPATSYALDAPMADVGASKVISTADGLKMSVRSPVGELDLRSRLIGRVNAWNLLAVVAELASRGFSPADIAARIEALEPVPGRLHRMAGPAGQQVIIDYAHSPDALRAALDSLRPLINGRLICVFGCGGERDRGKRPRMGRIAEALADQVVLTSDNPRSEEPLRILREVQSGMARPDRARVLVDRAEAIGLAVASARPGDLVLVAGKGHETTQEIAGQTLEFSDFHAVQRALETAA